jgi:pimeloyl-ACP methyl ester carboxylesterase
MAQPDDGGDMELETIAIHGNDIGYRSVGQGPVVLLIHGMAGSSETWDPILEPLGRSATALAPDLLGHGGSAKPRGDYSLGALASSLRDLLNALGHDRATIVGHSLGGGVAMQFAYQFPERCDRLVLVSAGGLGKEVSPLLRALSLPGAELVLSLGCAPGIRDAGASVGRFLTKVGVRPAPAASQIWRSYASLSDAEARTAFFHTLRAVIDAGGQRVSAEDRLYLASLLPTLIVWGDRDRIIPVAHARAAHEAMPGSRLEIFPGAGHYPHRDDPERFAEVLSDFVRSTEPATG